MLQALYRQQNNRVANRSWDVCSGRLLQHMMLLHCELAQYCVHDASSSSSSLSTLTAVISSGSDGHHGRIGCISEVVDLNLLCGGG